MSDRLTQLQICLDQLIEQFNAAVNYINSNSEQALLDEDPKSVINIAAEAPIAGQPEVQDSRQGQSNNDGSRPDISRQEVNKSEDTNSPQINNRSDFTNTLNELSTDIILKSRQITMLIDSLPGVGVSEETQVQMIRDLSEELAQVEKKRVEKIKEKEEVVKWTEELIGDVANGISSAKV
ncbi:mediator of RNA polymerase II transcription subunit 21 [[Candida] jaroonii]|uniref:Mediator of RNA polymerase II transcription subunit 21 n=1 Tax=[Candida] jaroonii TaxID=467808 RepID=A0ACA9YAW0_9ASCO|nr:mediator of RNA polymerase II transcription subunit 21 [[Candida] jaroonii]